MAIGKRWIVGVATAAILAGAGGGVAYAASSDAPTLTPVPGASPTDVRSGTPAKPAGKPIVVGEAPELEEVPGATPGDFEPGEVLEPAGEGIPVGGTGVTRTR